MNKIKITNEKERIKIEFDFDNILVARGYFQDEECIEDIVDALDYEESADDDVACNPEEKAGKAEVETLAKTLKTFIEKSPRLFYDAYNKAIKEAEI